MSAAGEAIIVVGASAGGLPAIQALLGRLPETLTAAVCGVVHLRPEVPSQLAPILQRGCPLPVTTAEDGEEIRAGRVYVARPDRHLLVERHQTSSADNVVELSRPARKRG